MPAASVRHAPSGKASKARRSVSLNTRSHSRSTAALQAERGRLLTLLQAAREQAGEERMRKGQVYRSVGYLCGAAALLLVL